MCGIFSIIGRNQEENLSTRVIQKSFSRLSRRGKDRGSMNVYGKNNNLLLGFHRLIINDYSPSADQPFVSGNVILACNGEIFNYKSLIEIYNLPVISNSDCEVILHLYKKIGFDETIRILDGTFAIILFDNTLNKLFVSRDKMGINPLFVGSPDYSGILSFASEAKALDLFCSNITQVIPGIHTFSFFDNFNTYSKTFSDRVFINYPIINNVPEMIRETLIASVKKRLMSDRPLGCLLSGGLDSSLIASILSSLLPKPEDLRTYSVGMEGSEDLKYARMVAEYLHSTHTEVIFTEEEGLSIIPEVIYTLETNDITTIRASVPMYILAKYIAENTEDVVIFSGEGSDELFGGYLYFKFAPSFTEFSEECRKLIENIHFYDGLRADRCLSAFSLEIRVPFLDHAFTDMVLSLDGKLKQTQPEKLLLRNAFKDFLPDPVLYRTKEAFSDGCSSNKKLWKDVIAEHTKNVFNMREADYYNKVFSETFKSYVFPMGYWMPNRDWIKVDDPSAKVLPEK